MAGSRVADTRQVPAGLSASPGAAGAQGRAAGADHSKEVRAGEGQLRSDVQQIWGGGSHDVRGQRSVGQEAGAPCEPAQLLWQKRRRQHRLLVCQTPAQRGQCVAFVLRDGNCSGGRGGSTPLLQPESRERRSGWVVVLLGLLLRGLLLLLSLLWLLGVLLLLLLLLGHQKLLCLQQQLLLLLGWCHLRALLLLHRGLWLLLLRLLVGLALDIGLLGGQLRAPLRRQQLALLRCHLLVLLLNRQRAKELLLLGRERLEQLRSSGAGGPGAGPRPRAAVEARAPPAAHQGRASSGPAAGAVATGLKQRDGGAHLLWVVRIPQQPLCAAIAASAVGAGGFAAGGRSVAVRGGEPELRGQQRRKRQPASSGQPGLAGERRPAAVCPRLPA